MARLPRAFGDRAQALRRCLAAAALAAALAIAACGGSDSSGGGGGPAGLSGVGDQRAGSVAALAQCSDWTEGTIQERMATVVDIREQLTPAGETSDERLDDEEAFEILDEACSNEFARGFRLYKVYARAAAFASFTE